MIRILLATLIAIIAGTASAGWQQTFGDDFNGSVDFKTWQTMDSFGVNTYSGGGIQEMQCYDDAALSTASGNLIVSVTKKLMPACRGTQVPSRMQYQSGRITTAKSFSQTYGYFEARMNFPAGQGFWPAFWLLPTSGFAWEIDGMEWVGKDPNTAYLTYHAWATSQHEPFQYRASSPLSSGWHTFGVDWQPSGLVWYIDGVERARTSKLNDRIPSTPGYLLLNLAVGGGWPGDPDATTVIPNRMLVDYVKAWKRVPDGKPDALPPTLPVVSEAAPLPTPAVRFSIASDRSNPASLQGATKTLADLVYVFVPDPGLKSVSFWIDSATPAAPTGAPTRVENAAPFDLAGTDSVGNAVALDLSGMSVGLHTITAKATNTDGTARTPVTASFTVTYAPLDTKALSVSVTTALQAARANDMPGTLTTLRAIRDQLDRSGL